VRFSERYGYKKVCELIQIDSIDDPLRNALWSLLCIHIWDNVHYTSGVYICNGYYLSNELNFELKTLCQRLWFSYFKNSLDQLDDNWEMVFKEIRVYFFKCEWYEVYDFIEFVAENYEKHKFREAFMKDCNTVLEREISAYRFVDGLLSRITDKEQLEEIELALEKSYSPIQTHIRCALEFLSNRETPNYRNSIKESISAVESLVVKTIGADKGTLGQLIKKLEDDIGLHPALRSAFSSLYGYTSDEGGIRHAILESNKIGFEDAKFFLVVCSAFINYVNAKAK
jgi:hypothetical protein